jgi:release factor glutamine methyltransferase
MTLRNFEQYQANALRQLEKAGVWDPRGDVLAIVAKHAICGAESADLVFEEFNKDIAERCARIPLGHILGYADFDGKKYVVGTGAFVPRQQSRALVDWLTHNHHLHKTSSVYDLCAGCGAIGIAVWAATGARVHCVENDLTALGYLARNIHRHCDGSSSVTALAIDITDIAAFSGQDATADAVIANPPYVPTATELLPEWTVHHPPGAIYSGSNGLELIEASCRLAHRLLKCNAPLLIEHGEGQLTEVRALLERCGFVSVNSLINTCYSDATGPSVITIGMKSWS